VDHGLEERRRRMHQALVLCSLLKKKKKGTNPQRRFGKHVVNVVGPIFALGRLALCSGSRNATVAL